MNLIPITTAGNGDPDRPVGWIQPRHERAVRAVRALDEGRFADAESNVSAIPDMPTPLRAWKSLLRAQTAAARKDWMAAAAHAHEAVVCALVASLESADSESKEMRRILGSALELLGLSYRRQERSGEAYSTHSAAYRIRGSVGSHEEQWESAVSLGLDADLLRRYDDAVRWFQIGAAAAVKSAEEPLARQAIAWTHLAKSLQKAGRFADAAAAAQTARDFRHRRDPTASALPVADVALARVLLRWAESRQESDPQAAASSLHEAIEVFQSAEESLAAFGPPVADELKNCIEQKELAQRLLASLSLSRTETLSAELKTI